MDAYNTAPIFSFTNMNRTRRLTTVIGVVLVLLMATMAVESALAQSKGKAKDKAPKTPPPPPANDYASRFKGAEASLVGLDRPYLVLDFAKSQLHLKLRGVTMRDYKFTLLSSTDEPKAFTDQAAASDTVSKSLVRLHVFESEPQLNDTVLRIVAEATTAPANLIQRFRPKHISVTYSNRLALDVYATDVAGKSTSWSDDLAEEVRLFADGFMCGERLKIQISRDDAMSFYGICRDATPLLVAP